MLPPLLLLALMGCAGKLPTSNLTTANCPASQTPTSGPVTNHGLVSTLPGAFDAVNNIGIGADGTLYAVESTKIDKITPDGQVQTFLQGQNVVFGGDFSKTIAEAMAIAGARDGTLYICGDFDRLYKLTPDGTLTSVKLPAEFHFDPGLAVDAQDNAYVAINPGLGIKGDAEILKVTPAGDVSVFAGRAGGGQGYADGPGAQALFNQPGALAFDSTGNLYVADCGNESIRRIAPDGTVSTVAGKGAPSLPPSPAPGMPSPDLSDVLAGTVSLKSLTVDLAGNLYFTSYDNRIHRLTPDGVLSVFAGDGRRCVQPYCSDWSCVTPEPGNCLKDGAAADAEFNGPTAIVADPSGKLYVLDGASNAAHQRIRVVQ